MTGEELCSRMSEGLAHQKLPEVIVREWIEEEDDGPKRLKLEIFAEDVADRGLAAALADRPGLLPPRAARQIARAERCGELRHCFQRLARDPPKPFTRDLGLGAKLALAFLGLAMAPAVVLLPFGLLGTAWALCDGLNHPALLGPPLLAGLLLGPLGVCVMYGALAGLTLAGLLGTLSRRSAARIGQRRIDLWQIAWIVERYRARLSAPEILGLCAQCSDGPQVRTGLQRALETASRTSLANALRASELLRPDLLEVCAFLDGPDGSRAAHILVERLRPPRLAR